MDDLILKKINSPDIKLSKSDKKILNYIGGDYHRITTMSIQTLAKYADVSEPTINRLTKKLGCKGFPDFKLRIAQETSQLHQVKKMQLSGQIESQSMRDKILDVVAESVLSIKHSTAIDEIEKAVSLFANARRICFFGLGASGSVALDAQHKFLRFGVPTFCQNDYISQQMICSTFDKKDLLCLISYTGKTKYTIEMAMISRDNGIPCIGITRSNSKLSELCDVTLNAETSLEEDGIAPMSSRIIHLVIIDILTALLSKNKQMVSREKIQAIQDTVKKSRLYTPANENIDF